VSGKAILRRILLPFRNSQGTRPEPECDALTYNSVGHVDAKNEDVTHWLGSRDSDKKFIDAIYADFVQLCRVDTARTVADYGCGTGVLVDNLKRDFPSLTVSGFDFSEKKVLQCREYYRFDPPCFFHGSVYDEASTTYDVVVATEVLEHLEQPKAAVRSLVKRLAPGGRLFLTVPDGRKDSFAGHIHFWSPESWQLFLSEAVTAPLIFQAGILHDRNFALIGSP